MSTTDKLSGLTINGTLKSSDSPTSSEPQGNYPADITLAGAFPYKPSGTLVSMKAGAVKGGISHATGNTGTTLSSQATIPLSGPRVVMQACIATEGLYPQRP